MPAALKIILRMRAGPWILAGLLGACAPRDDREDASATSSQAPAQASTASAPRLLAAPVNAAMTTVAGRAEPAIEPTTASGDATSPSAHAPPVDVVAPTADAAAALSAQTGGVGMALPEIAIGPEADPQRVRTAAATHSRPPRRNRLRAPAPTP